MQTFTLQNQEYIELNKLLKHLHLVDTGGMANDVIVNGEVKVNGAFELQKRKKLRKGDHVKFGEIEVKIE